MALSPDAIPCSNDSVASIATGCSLHEPRDLDILCGKETKARNHKGSKCFRIFVDRYQARYEEANNKHKRGEITKEMYLTIKEASIKFLKFSEERNGWVEISSTEARDKITHALRFAQKRSRRKNKRKALQRQNSDSTHRSETSTSTNASYDWDQLLQQQQQHLAGLTLGNHNNSLRSFRSSFSSTGSQQLSQDSSHSSVSVRQRMQSSATKPSPKVSFAVAEPSVCSAVLSTIYSSTTAATCNTPPISSIPSTLESVPLPVDLSSTQHFDMHQSQTDLDVEQTDRPPRMPSRPTEEDDDEETNNGFDTIMDTTATGFDLLDPLEEEHMRDSDSQNSNNSTMPTIDVSNLQPLTDGELQLLQPPSSNAAIIASLEPRPIATIPHAMIHTNDRPVGEENWLLNAHLADMNLNGGGQIEACLLEPTPIREPMVVGAHQGGLAPSSMHKGATTFQQPNPIGALQPNPKGSLQQQQQQKVVFPNPNINSHILTNGTGDYSQLLMQEPLWEWEPRGEGNLHQGNNHHNNGIG